LLRINFFQKRKSEAKKKKRESFRLGGFAGVVKVFE